MQEMKEAGERMASRRLEAENARKERRQAQDLSKDIQGGIDLAVRKDRNRIWQEMDDKLPHQLATSCRVNHVMTLLKPIIFGQSNGKTRQLAPPKSLDFPWDVDTYVRRHMFKRDKWIWLSAWDLETRNVINRPACYAIYVEGELSYVGSSIAPRFRFGQHGFSSNPTGSYDTPWGTFDMIHGKIYYPSSYGCQAMLEQRLIKRLQPRFNARP